MPFTPPAARPFLLPQRVHLPLPDAAVVDAAVGDAHSLVVTASGAVYVLGANDAFQLGTGDKQPAVQARELTTLGRPVVRVFARGDWSAALSASGDVAVWGTAAAPAPGSSSRTQGADSPLTCSRQPYWLAWLPSGLGSSTTKVTLLACGSRHLLLHTSDGALHACGDDTWGQLGLGADPMHAGARVFRHAPCRIDRLRGLRISQLAGGDAHSAAVVADGRLFTWGCGIDGRLGHSVRDNAGGSSASRGMCATPTAVSHSAWVGDPALAKMHGARRGDGTSLLAGGQQPHGHPPSGTERVVHVACGDTHTLAVTHTGAVWVWGAGPAGQLGLGGPTEVTLPSRVEALRGVPVCKCVAGAQHSVAQLQGSDGPLFVWGAGQQGQLGLGLPAVDVPVPAHLPPSSAHVGSHAAVVAPHDGGNAHDATTASAALEAAECHPLRGVPIGGVACGRAATLVWRPDGTALYACGSGAFGQPGQRHATLVVQQTSACLTEEQAAQAAAAVSIVRIIRPDMVAPSLLDNLTAVGPFTGPVVAHVVHTLLECLLSTPFDNAYLTLYARLAHVLATQLQGVSPYGFRVALVGAIEDAAVRVMATSVHALGAALPEAPHWGVGAPGSVEAPLADATAARQAAAAAAASREGCRALGAFVRELAEMRVLQAEDVEDLARGCPSSLHSRGLADSDLVGRKLAFFTRMVAPPQRRVQGQPAPPVRMPPLRMSSSEETAWRQLREAQEAAKLGAMCAADALPVTRNPGVRMGLPPDVKYPAPRGLRQGPAAERWATGQLP